VPPGALRATVMSGSGDADPEPRVIDPAAEPGRLVRFDAEHGVFEDGDGARHAVLVLRGAGAGQVEVIVGGWRFEVAVEPAARAALRERASRAREGLSHSGPVEVRAIIPGVVVSVAVAAGDRVVAGQQLLAVEAMKMQNELRAPRDGTVERVAAAAGGTIDVGDLLVVIGPTEGRA
jgi:biotin carboxyl carrier protein